MPELKKKIASKINDIDQMLNELSIDEALEPETKESAKTIDINQLDAVDVLNTILN